MKITILFLTSILMLGFYSTPDIAQVQPEPIPKEQIEKAKALIKSVSADDLAAVDTAAKYKLFCTNCHGSKGDLKLGGATDLSQSEVSLEGSIAQIYYGRGFMMGFKGMISDAEIVALAKYVEAEFRK